MKELIFRFIVILTAFGALIAVVFILLDDRSAVNVSSGYNSQELIMMSETTAPYDESSGESVVVIEDNYPALNTSEAFTSINNDELQTEITSGSRTIITSRVRKEFDQNSVYIDMKNILQLPELPVGCEITALTILLNHCGFDVGKTDLAKKYLPIGTNYRTEDGKVYKDSFFDYFIGDPFSRGYGCFSNAIEKAANDYINDNGGGFTVHNISGSEPDVLYDYISKGIPVLCWATDGMIEPEYYESWYDYNSGEKLDWYLNEHCFLLAGFNMSGNTVTLNDPMKGIIDYNIDKFETRYSQMYKQAIVILKNDTSDINDSQTETAVVT